MNKKAIITNTAMFIFVIVFVVIFKTIFGDDNTLIGVTTITAMLMFLSRDLTVSPLRNTLKLIGTNLLIGIGTEIIVMNVWLGIVINFILVFIIAYSYCYNLRNPLYVPFLLQYQFLLTKPVPTDEFGMRLIALIVGALIIMLPQILFNRNKLTKSGNKILINVCENILSKIHNLKECEDTNEKSKYDNNEVNTKLDKFREMIYDKRDSENYLTEEATVKLSISVALEGINSIICKYSKNNVDEYTLKTLEQLLNETKNILSTKQNNKSTFNLDDLINHFSNEDISDIYNLQLLDSMLVLSKSIDDLNNLDKKEYHLINKSEEMPNLFSKEYIKSMFIGSKSIKYCYAMRLAITTTIVFFIMHYFKIDEARWILFTVISVTTPIYETSKDKIKYRLVATLIGSVIVYVLFSIFHNETARLLIVLLVGYLQGYFKQYKYNMVLITVSAVGAAAIAGNVHDMTLERIFFVCIGIVIAILANKFLFPYKVEDSNKQLRVMYNESIISMFNELKNLAEGIKRPQSIKNLYVSLSLIESKVRMNAQVSDNPYYNEIIRERRSLVGNVYELYMWMLKGNINEDDKKIIIEDIKYLIHYNTKLNKENLKYLENGINKSKDVRTRIILSSILVILHELDKINKLSEKAKI